MPPIVDGELSLTAISQKWKDDWTERQKKIVEYCQGTGEAKPCPFAFISTQAGTHRFAGPLNDYIKRYSAENTGWHGTSDMRFGWQQKTGLVPNKKGASLLLVLPKLASSVRYIKVQSMKSYGEQWAESETQFNATVENDGNVEYQTSFSVLGYHNSNTSIGYATDIDLGEHAAHVNRTLKLRMTLVGGTTFKIMGLLICSR